MRRLLNIILLTIILYIAYLAYKGDGVVDFREVLVGASSLFRAIFSYITSILKPSNF